MKNKLLGIASVAALMFGASGVANAHTYVEGSAGVTMIDSLDWNNSSYDMDNGWNAAVSVGTDSWLSGWDVEAEFSYDKMEYSCCNPNNTHEYRLMGNVTHDFAMGGFTPYLGAGLGLAWVTYDYGSGTSEGDAQAAYQLIGGVRVPLSDNFSLFGEYRYQGLFDDAQGDGDTWEHAGHNFAFGARYNLN